MGTCAVISFNDTRRIMKTMEKIHSNDEDRVSKLVDSLELVTARMLEMTVANNQVATSLTPEMRRLFDTWIQYMSDEILIKIEENESLDIQKIADTTGLTSSSVLSLLVYLERKGAIEITQLTAVKGDGHNKDICDCYR